MSQNGGGVALHDFEIAAGETDACFGWGEQGAGLSDHAIGVVPRDLGCFLRPGLIDHDDECRELAQPLEGRVIHYQVQVLARAGDGSHIAFVGGALEFEEGLVQAEQSITKGLEAGAEVWHATIVT